jgi:hypothetical protein
VLVGVRAITPLLWSLPSGSPQKALPRPVMPAMAAWRFARRQAVRSWLGEYRRRLALAEARPRTSQAFAAGSGRQPVAETRRRFEEETLPITENAPLLSHPQSGATPAPGHRPAVAGLRPSLPPARDARVPTVLRGADAWEKPGERSRCSPRR